MNIWWGDPQDAYESEEVEAQDRNDVIVKDKQGRPISIEIIGLLPKELNVSEKLDQLTAGKKTPFILSSE